MSLHGRPDSFMPLYVGDWDGDTGHLDCEQDGAYGRIVRWYWRNGPPADDDALLARIVRMDLARWRLVRPAILPFFEIRDGRLHHHRVELELEKAERRYAKAVAAAAARYSKPAHVAAQLAARSIARDTAQTLLEALPAACQPQPQRKERAPKSALSTPPPELSSQDAAPLKSPMAPEWSGPPALREAIVRRMGETWACTWFDACEWDEDAHAILTPRGLTTERLQQNVRRELHAAGVEAVRVKGQFA